MSTNWGEEEQRATVEAYVDMHRREANGERFQKKRYYEALAARFGRTSSAYEYRMQNISHVLSLQGRRWVTGLKPKQHVGTNIVRTLERLIAECEGQHLGSSATFRKAVKQRMQAPPPQAPEGNRKPSRTQAAVTQFARSEAVAAWVRREAAGKCESCGASAPFVGEDGLPFLEVHHVRRLADGGEDTIQNSVAVCPNCHRQLHYGSNKDALARALIAKLPRLHPDHNAGS